MASSKKQLGEEAAVALIEPIIRKHLKGVDPEDADAVEDALEAAGEDWSDVAGNLFNITLAKLGLLEPCDE